MFLKSCGIFLVAAHQGEAPWDEFWWDLPGQTGHRTHLVTIRCRRHPDPAREHVTKCPKALESRIHGDICDRKIRCHQQMFRQLETSGKLTLLWCFTENGFEQTTKMKSGHAGFARNLPYGTSDVDCFAQQLRRIA